MSDDAKDAGLVAMISSILGGNKRAEAAGPPPLDGFVQAVPAGGTVAEVAQIPEAESPKLQDSSVEAVTAATPAAAASQSLTPDGKRRLPAEAIADLVLGELRKIEDFPASGVSVTVYGYRHWNAMVTFAPFSTTFRNATRFRQALPDLVFKLRRFVELEI
ncbi:hypothetical protein UB31_27710 [Bradyrhizobium sp. LTSP849]|jgi:hypothetical protein|uniref:hypothetical protein n=1 Tax=unclassified Bradyrhizobium TaxID=2631580 RepID=UPI0005D2304E|nr:MULTISPECIES: hypothetical protein [unclassified Bradyrhizobium]KJC40102.1 hypothetical protein UB31_27710 [Bradyrhizobium sp. LTSP849]KJC45315.1 hypothetical protein UP06_14920 [Bradyrhizobium sp. LTSP857]